MKIDEVVRGQVAELFGRFRPAQGLSPDEVKSIGAERREWAQRLTAQLKSIESVPAGTVIRHFRAVVHEIKGEPAYNRMPQPSEIAYRVERRCVEGVQKPWCPVCERFGSPGVFRDSPEGEKRRGEIRIGDTWYCAAHHEVSAWFLWRQRNFEHGTNFEQVPPMCIIPKASWRNGQRAALLLEFTDGVFCDGFVEWIRQECVKHLDAALLEEPASV